MSQAAKDPGRFWVSRVAVLAVLLVAFIWAMGYMSAEARVRRATLRVVALSEKSGEESPVSLGLTVNRLGKFLATNAVLELEDYGVLATGRQEIVSLFAQIRGSLAAISFAHPEIAAVAAVKGVVDVHLAARYRLASDAGDSAEGDGAAELHWVKGRDGWQIQRAVLHAEEGAKVPGGWK
jgi:hypothetical protein